HRVALFPQPNAGFSNPSTRVGIALKAGRFLGIGPAIATALRVRLSRRCCGLARGLVHRRGPACPVLAAALPARSGPCHRRGPVCPVLAAALRVRSGPWALPTPRGARSL